MKRLFSILMLTCINMYGAAQTQPADSAKVLENIIVNAFESHTEMISTPASISKVGYRDLNRYDNTTILPAINTKPGVRMDERSPGSYRLNIRGSSLRSPFGVSNVKVYYNGIPFTGPGGTTDLNMLGFYDVGSIEIIRGPAGSMYGAGTGGALLIESKAGTFEPGIKAGYSHGSFGTNSANATIRLGNDNVHNTISYQHMNSDGYRDHTQMRRDMISWNPVLKQSDKARLEGHFFYSDLYYQTPGGLTKAEYDENPRAARPAAGIFPGADEAQAAIYDQAFLAAFSIKQTISHAWQNTTSVYGYYFRHNNPTFRNYTRRVEPDIGARTHFSYRKEAGHSIVTVHIGGEFQKSFITSRLYDNNGGTPGAMQTDDEVNYSQGFVFAQARVEIPQGWSFTGGASFNKSKVGFERFTTAPTQNLKREFKNEIAPRMAILKKLRKTFSVYASVQRGFSSPASSELLSTSGVFNRSLQAESGVNYEVGSKGNFLNNRLFFDITAFRYRLTDAIVQRQDAGGGIFYENAGSTLQKGLESYLSYAFIDNPYRYVNYGFAYLSHTWSHFRYDDYKQLDDDFSGNKIIGVAPHTLAAGIDIATRGGMTANATYYFSGKIPLNNENTVFAKPYHLIGLRLGYKATLAKKSELEFFAGAQNLLDETYSLGNDINAAGGRYYNAAAGRNYYAGISFAFGN